MITNQWFCGIEQAPDAQVVRNKVFVEEQGFTPEAEFDVFDNQAMHVVLYDNDTPVGTGRVYHDGKTFRLGRICVVKEMRGQNMGDLLLRLLLIKAFEFNPSQVRLDAQVRVQQFYEKFGFVVDGEITEEEGVPHVPMYVTKETLVMRSGCGKEMRYEDLFPEKQ